VCPCFIKRREERKKKDKFYIYLGVTHTHTPGRSRVNPERQEEGKSGHRRRAKGQNRAGGEGNERTSRTNLRGETDLTKTEHTPKPHDTLRRSTGEELGTEWGLFCDGRETTKTINLKRTQFQLQQVSCVAPLRDRSQVAPKGINSCSSSNELGARYVQLHQKTIKGKKTTCKRVPAWSIFHVAVQMSLQKLRKWKRNSSCSSVQSHIGEGACSAGSQGTVGAAGHRKKADEWKGQPFRFT